MAPPKPPAVPFLETVFNHVVLPPKIPGENDQALACEAIEHNLTARFLVAARIMRDHVSISDSDEWQIIYDSIQACQNVNSGPNLSSVSLMSEFANLANRKIHLLVIHIREQNAGLWLGYHKSIEGDFIVFEAFEASPKSETVLASQNALRKDFPEHSIVVPISVFSEVAFQKSLASFLERAGSESIKTFAARSNKAGSSASENRDTVDPALITHLLNDILEVNGRRCFPPQIRKRLRDEVYWTDGVIKPWRRNPFYLILRAGLHRHLCTTFGHKIGTAQFKFLMCVMLSNFLIDCLDVLPPEHVMLLKTKLCRRIVKLEMDRESSIAKRKSSESLSETYELLFSKFTPLFLRATQQAIDRVTESWVVFKKESLRPIELLPIEVVDPRSLRLTLSHSHTYLRSVQSQQVDQHPKIHPPRPYQFSIKPNSSNIIACQFAEFAQEHFALAQLEMDIEVEVSGALDLIPSTPISSQWDEFVKAAPEHILKRCKYIEQLMNQYLSTTTNTYDTNTEQKSMMLLHVLELWLCLDRVVAHWYPLLKSFKPPFPSEMMDVLQLPLSHHMRRVRAIQSYLECRHLDSSSKLTIFVSPQEGCFAEQYFNGSPELQRKQEHIDYEAETARAKKREEWQAKSEEYDGHMKAVSESSCVYLVDDERPLVMVHDYHNCRKCWHQRKAYGLRIEVHEDPLPPDPIMSKAVVFELGCPQTFMTYRDLTWKILVLLCSPSLVNSGSPKLTLSNYLETRPYHDNINLSLAFSLASKSKSFLDTHYKERRFPTVLDDILLPNGLRLNYYDSRTNLWATKHVHEATFAHHCQIILPKSSPFSSLCESFNVADGGPTSFEIIASQTGCPVGLNIHEYMTFQSLTSGKIRRWLNVLMELGSSNLNFSTHAVSSFVSQLVLQVGPTFKNDALRTVHRIFRDEHFTNRLLAEIDLRLENIAPNPRENHCMNMLITLLLRVVELQQLVQSATNAIVTMVGKLLNKARNITFKWLSMLREEYDNVEDAESTRKISIYTIWSALLCRRTLFVPSLDAVSVENELRHFISCSIEIQHNMPGDPAALQIALRNALANDLKTTHNIRLKLRRAVLEAPPDVVLSALGPVWSASQLCQGNARCEFLAAPNDWVLESLIPGTDQKVEQKVHYDILLGRLLIDGQPLGKLPDDVTTSPTYKRLFGNQIVTTYKSPLPGMTYVLSATFHGQQVHLGHRNGKLFVRTFDGITIKELLPTHIFGIPNDFDLPSPLVHNVYHWLDLTTQIIDVRTADSLWVHDRNDWQVNLVTKEAISGSGHILVDPKSELFAIVARIFSRFEAPGFLTVTKAVDGTLTVELRRLELLFFVNEHYLLECTQLQSEIDPNQDIGTFYGFNSKIVLRSTINQNQRSILVPMGVVTHARRGIHVSVDIAPGSYCRFGVNDLLGRIECPFEPRLLYLKALIHALTSFVLPDDLTGKTGTEEAIHALQQGHSQPWVPLTAGPWHTLQVVATLTPSREYYPKDMKFMQKVAWNPTLTTTIQSDKFRTIVEEIWHQSDKLSTFSAGPSVELLQAEGDSFLSNRSSFRRDRFARRGLTSTDSTEPPDVICQVRPGHVMESSNVVECTRVIRDWPQKFNTTSSLASILHNWSDLGGFDLTSVKIVLSDCLSTEFAQEWGSLISLYASFKPEDKYDVMFITAVISFRLNVNMDFIRSLIAFAINKELKGLSPPRRSGFVKYAHNEAPSAESLFQKLQSCHLPYVAPDDIPIELLHIANYKKRRQLQKEEQARLQLVQNECRLYAMFLLRQWPDFDPNFDPADQYQLIDKSKASLILLPEWQRMVQNIELSRYVDSVQLVLNRQVLPIRDQETLPPVEPRPARKVMVSQARGIELLPLLQDLVHKTGPNDSRALQSITNQSISRLQASVAVEAVHHVGRQLTIKANQDSHSQEISELELIIAGISGSSSSVRQAYGASLGQSLEALKQKARTSKHAGLSFDFNTLSASIVKAQEDLEREKAQIVAAFEKGDRRVKWMKRGDLWPCLSPVDLLGTLRSTSACIFGAGMKESLVRYAVAVTALQRYARMMDADLKGNKQKLQEEWEHVGHENFDPHVQTDWLLFEIDANLLIREGQVSIALATISPPSKENSLLQMNMGQGKTSVIMPMIASILADKKNLLRLVVPKALLSQTAQLLQGRLGGLVGRRVKHIPFSRKTSTDKSTIQMIFDIHREVLKTSSIMLALPEHILSFALSGRQRMSDGSMDEAQVMINIEGWMRRVCRDVLDESDFTLAVRTQLIYPSGSHASVDGSPHRWETAQVLLGLVSKHLGDLKTRYRDSVKVVERLPDAFPIIYFLRKDVEDELLALIVDDICSGRTSLLPMNDCRPADRIAVKRFISDAKVSDDVVTRMKALHTDNAQATANIYLLRGLLVHRILLMCLKKRWNIQYGLHVLRDPVAVPFHAKSVPSEQGEWGHPDVSIILTCLSFYYDGLSLAQLRQSLEHVLKSDDPGSEYDRWTLGIEDLPGFLREWSAINIDDSGQLQRIWQHTSHNVIVIEYFLNNFVFPKYAKSFRMKLQASGWDIPLFTPEQAIQARTTGFSGTNDNRSLLPLNIKQKDLPGFSHTNAEVLTYLLQPRNRRYVQASVHGQQMSEKQILQTLATMNIRVLIDAGAQILEMDNLDLVTAWLKADRDALAAVYFDVENKPYVLYRQGHRVPLAASPFAENMERCLVYVSEAHCRGTDLKLPPDTVGALTLGQGQTKDHTVQAAMRLRQLATTQSIVWVSPPQVHQSILDYQKKSKGDKLDSRDVISWLLKQTCDGLEQFQPLFYAQGADYCRRFQAAVSNPAFLNDVQHRDEYLLTLRSNEQQTLRQLYEPKVKAPKMATNVEFTNKQLASFMSQLDHRRRGFQDNGNAVHASALQEVEQEREVAFECQTIREIQKPHHFQPLTFSGLHRDIIVFVKTGRLVADSTAAEPWTAAMRRTIPGQKYAKASKALTTKLFVSTEFSRTAKGLSDQASDNFVRPVNWILWSSVSDSAMAIIPEEAEELIPHMFDSQRLADSRTLPTYLMTYSAPTTRRMNKFNKMNFYTLPTLPDNWSPPTWLPIELGIFAGRLYFDHSEYAPLSEYLGIQEARGKLEEVEREFEHDDSMIDKWEEEEEAAEMMTAARTKAATLSRKPLTFMQEWLALRRKGQDFGHTPMGFICQGKALVGSHPFFAREDSVVEDGVGGGV